MRRLIDVASRLTQAVESPTTATTTYAYDNANRLTSEDRTGANPYLSDYTYNSRGLRATAFRSEGGVTSHDGTYTYDDASRLTQVVESASGSAVNEYYTWYNDGSLKTYPGPGYDRLLDYDEETRLTSIKQDYGATETLVFEYAYGFDGGRRWRKDHAQSIWNWYPCGVACCAGELVVLESDLTGGTWLSTAQRVGDRIVAPDSSFHSNIPGNSTTTLEGTTQIGAQCRDAYGVERGASPDSPSVLASIEVRDEEIYAATAECYLPQYGMQTQQGPSLWDRCQSDYNDCMAEVGAGYTAGLALCSAAFATCGAICLKLSFGGIWGMVAGIACAGICFLAYTSCLDGVKRARDAAAKECWKARERCLSNSSRKQPGIRPKIIL